MRFVGLDLAWGTRNPSGVAVLAADGTLDHVGAARDHRTVLDTVRPFTTGACLVGIDAPLIVRNATGRRPAEAALNADFARFDAGAHPANTSLPVFAAGLPGGADRRCVGPGRRSAVHRRTPGDRGVPASGHRRVVPAGPHTEVQAPRPPHRRTAQIRSAAVDVVARRARHRRPVAVCRPSPLAGAAPAGGDGDRAGSAGPGGGSGGCGVVRLHRDVRPPASR